MLNVKQNLITKCSLKIFPQHSELLYHIHFSLHGAYGINTFEKLCSSQNMHFYDFTQSKWLLSAYVGKVVKLIVKSAMVFCEMSLFFGNHCLNSLWTIHNILAYKIISLKFFALTKYWSILTFRPRNSKTFLYYASTNAVWI